jgi:hypothetical protein
MLNNNRIHKRRRVDVTPEPQNISGLAHPLVGNISARPLEQGDRKVLRQPAKKHNGGPLQQKCSVVEDGDLLTSLDQNLCHGAWILSFEPRGCFVRLDFQRPRPHSGHGSRRAEKKQKKKKKKKTKKIFNHLNTASEGETQRVLQSIPDLVVDGRFQPFSLGGTGVSLLRGVNTLDDVKTK